MTPFRPTSAAVRRQSSLAPYGAALFTGVLATLSLAACGEPMPDTANQPGQPNNATPVQPNGNTGGNVVPTPKDPNNGVVTQPNDPVVNPNLPANGNQPAAAAALRFLGRVPATTPVFTWPGNAAEISFQGTGGNFALRAQNGNVRVGVSVDGGNVVPQLLASNTNTQVSFGPLSAGNHVVRASLLSEGRLGTVGFRGYTTNGTPLPVTAPQRRLAFIGDSITAAYGIDGSNANCMNNASVEDATASYAALAAKTLQSDYALLAVAGKGVMRNDTNDATGVTMGQIWIRATANDADPNYNFSPAEAPQGVVIALGTNDYDYTGANGTRAQVDPTAFRSAYTALINDVRTRWPGVKIVLCSSPMLDDNSPYVGDAQNPGQHTALLNDLNAIAVGMADVTVVDFGTLAPAMRTGCVSHPNRSAHTAMAQQLVPVLQAALGW